MHLLRRLCIVLLLVGVGCGLVRRNQVPPGGRLDVNQASLRQLEGLPGVTPSMAQRIYQGRPYGSLDELVERGLLSERELDRVRSSATVTPGSAGKAAGNGG